MIAQNPTKPPDPDNLIKLSPANANRQVQLPPIPQQKYEPTVEEILSFGAQIGIKQEFLDHIVRQTGWKRRFWWEVLHELSHFAVKPDFYLDYWQAHGCPGGVPNLNFTRWEPQSVVPFPGAYQHPLDETPDEYGARAWGLLVLDFKGWISPLKSSKWHAYTQKWDKNRYWQWNWDYTKTDDHPYGDGLTQLEAIGIDFKQGDLSCLRPTVQCAIGSYPVAQLSWRACG